MTLGKACDLSGVEISHLKNEGGFKSCSLNPWKFFGTNLSRSTFLCFTNWAPRQDFIGRKGTVAKTQKHRPGGYLDFTYLNIQDKLLILESILRLNFREIFKMLTKWYNTGTKLEEKAVNQYKSAGYWLCPREDFGVLKGMGA